MRGLACNVKLRWLALSLICVSFFPYASGAWLPAFFIRVHGLTTAEVGRFAGIAVGLGGTLGTLGAGFLCDVLSRRLPRIQFALLAIALALACVTLVLTLFIEVRSAALACMFLFDICAYAFLGPIVTLIQQEAASATRALAIALCVAVSNIINLGLALPVVGAMSDALKPQYGVRSIRYALMIGAIAATACGLVALWRASRIQSTRENH